MIDNNDAALTPPLNTVVCCFCHSRVPTLESRFDENSRRWCLPCYNKYVIPNQEKDPKIAKSPF